MDNLGVQQSPSKKSELSVLTYYQANDLIKAIDTTRLVLENYINIIEDTHILTCGMWLTAKYRKTKTKK